jgi:hypothetical protein
MAGGKHETNGDTETVRNKEKKGDRRQGKR